MRQKGPTGTFADKVPAPKYTSSTTGRKSNTLLLLVERSRSMGIQSWIFVVCHSTRIIYNYSEGVVGHCY
jgi:hypothetical protein